ncbi:MAG: Hsp20/alpha crystallin family protein [Proteobacteria bacterium]|nr:Hsp20/alpha crystallin family protein [Pseudomonadota bacterium]
MIEDNYIIITNSESITFNKINTFSPPLDIYECSHGVNIDIEIPGLEKEDIKISIVHNKLFIKGEKRFKKEYQKQKYYLLERPYGIFNRVFELPENTDIENIKAKIKDGVLSISIPYKKSKMKNVTINE